MTAFHKGKSNPDNTDINNLSDKTVHLLKLPYKGDNIENFKMLNIGYNNNIYRRRISEALLVKQYHPSLIKRNNFVLLRFFDWF